MTIEETGVWSDTVAMTDLGEQLRSPDGGTRRGEIGARFDHLIQRTQDAVSAGVPIEEHARLLKIQRAAETARRLIGT